MKDGRQAAAELARVREDVERWRRTRSRLSPMPQALWTEACAVARELGVAAVAQALGLNAARLWAHVRADVVVKQPLRRPAAAKPAPPPPAQFVEVQRPDFLPAGPVVEVSDARGARLTVRLATGAAVDVPALVAAFRR